MLPQAKYLPRVRPVLCCPARFSEVQKMTRRSSRLALKKMLTFLVVVLAGIVPAIAIATEDETGLWAILSSTDAFETASGTSRWQYWFDAQLRFVDLGSGASQYVLRPGVGYDISDNMSVWAGYGYFHSRTASGATVTEDRYWQQLVWNVARLSGGTLSMRARLEQRSISRGDDLGWVLRYMAKFVRPIGDAEDVEMFFSIEPFFDLVDTDWAGQSGFRAIRTAAGIGWKLSPKLTIETGYMHHYTHVDNAENRANHLGVVNFKAKF
jgi:hypothetical protein